MEKQQSVLTILLLFGLRQNHHNLKTFYIQISDEAVFDQKSSSWMVLKTLNFEEVHNEIMKLMCSDRISPHKWVCLHFVVKIRLRYQNLLIEL